MAKKKQEGPILLRKMATKTVGFSASVIGKLLSDENPQVHLYNIVGIVRKVETGEGAYGPWKKLKGDFAAILIHPVGEGEKAMAIAQQFRSNSAFVPNPWDDQLEQALLASEDSSVEFGFEVWAKLPENDNAQARYEYFCKPIVKTTQNDPISGLVEKALPPAN